MQFGHFDDSNKEYVITTPKTPYPWINYLGTENFFGIISHQAGGYCFYRDARLVEYTSALRCHESSYLSWCSGLAVGSNRSRVRPCFATSWVASRV